MSRCLGSMQHVCLLSEIHPAATRLFNPLRQADDWFSLLTKADVAAIRGGMPLDFNGAIALIDRRCRQRMCKLVLRDWAHLDFTGFPWVEKPGYRLSLAESLQEDFELLTLFMVRHPVDQWLSLSMLGLMQKPIADGKLSIPFFLAGYEAFAKQAAQGVFIRYEDFTHQPETIMQKACERLELQYDAGFLQRWQDYKTITGDVQSTRGGNEITPLTRRPCEPDLLAVFEGEAAYWNSLNLLGYEQAAKKD